MRISDWSSDVCSSDLRHAARGDHPDRRRGAAARADDQIYPASGRDRFHGGYSGDHCLGPGVGLPWSCDRQGDRESGGEGKRVVGGVEFGGRLIIKKKKRIIELLRTTKEII